MYVRYKLNAWTCLFNIHLLCAYIMSKTSFSTWAVPVNKCTGGWMRIRGCPGGFIMQCPGGGAKDTLMIFIGYNGVISFVLEIVRGFFFKAKEGEVCWSLFSMGRGRLII